MLVPAIQQISSASTNYEKPRIQLVFILSVDEGEWILFNDESVGVDVGELAKLQFKSFQVCAENTPTSNVTKLLMQSCHLTALPISEEYKSNLAFHPNSFLVTGSDAPLLALRVSIHQHPPGELLIKQDASPTTGIYPLPSLIPLPSPIPLPSLIPLPSPLFPFYSLSFPLSFYSLLSHFFLFLLFTPLPFPFPLSPFLLFSSFTVFSQSPNPPSPSPSLPFLSIDSPLFVPSIVSY